MQGFFSYLIMYCPPIGGQLLPWQSLRAGRNAGNLVKKNIFIGVKNLYTLACSD
jgi:hypothetical protein